MKSNFSTLSEKSNTKFEGFAAWWAKHWGRDIQPTSSVKNACRYLYNDLVGQIQKQAHAMPCHHCKMPFSEGDLVEMKWTGYDMPSRSSFFVCRRCADSFINVGSASEVL